MGDTEEVDHPPEKGSARPDDLAGVLEGTDKRLQFPSRARPFAGPLCEQCMGSV